MEFTKYRINARLAKNAACSRGNGFLSTTTWLAVVIGCIIAAANVKAATVDGSSGYTNDFSAQPLATDWSARSIGTLASDFTGAGALEAAVQTNSAAIITNRVVSISLNPPIGNALATWSSPGLYLQTRPSANSATLLMATLVNNTGTNAGSIHINYDFVTNRAAGAAEEVRGHLVYYSLSGATNSWTKIEGLSQTSQGSLSAEVTLSGAWSNGASLYLLWADDNGSASTDEANDIDNFSITVTGAALLPGACYLTAPANGRLFITPATVQFSADAFADPATTISAVGFYDVNQGHLGSVVTGPYAFSRVLNPGIYEVYAVETNTSRVLFSGTNTIQVVNPLAVSLTAPLDGASYPHLSSIVATGVVAGGAGPFTVRFYTNGVLAGVADGNGGSAYYKDLGPLFLGSHTVQATVTDANGWTSNSTLNSLTITGRVFASIYPADGASFNYGQSITLTGFVAGGIAPYSVTFFTNGQAAGTAGPGASPFSQSLGLLPVGAYNAHVRATDSSAPVDQTDSATSTFTIVANPLTATLTNPTNGQTAVAGANLVLSATGSVNAPVTISSIEFFADGASIGIDSNAPYSAIFSTPDATNHTFYVVVTDSLGRPAVSLTNTATFIVDPLANNNFNNRFALGTPAHVSGANAGANTEFGEPTSTGGFGGTQWGATLWWKWTAPVSGTVTIDTVGSSFNTFLAVYTGTAVNALSLVGRNDNAPGSTTVSLVTFNATEGTEYEIQVGGVRPFGFGTQPATGSIQLNLAVPPSVAITSPTNGSAFLVGTNFVVNATASSAAGAITKVDLYRSGTLAGTSSNAPYDFVVNNAPPGTNSLYAVATDSIGQQGFSTVVNVGVLNSGLTLTTPSDGATFLNANPITISAFALPPMGTITNVEFFVDGEKFSEDATEPFSVVWSNVVDGSHRLSAVGQADDGASYNSQQTYIAVVQSLISSNSIWKYLDNGSDQGTSWMADAFDDSGWGSGPAPLGYSDSNGRQPLTTVSFGPDSTNKYPTTYFRQPFVVSNAASYANLILNVQRDDGVILYLNGTEVTRLNMPSGPVTYTNFASTVAQDDGGTTFTLNASPSLLVEGTNVFAVEIHQDSGNSSDIWFVMQMVAVPAIVRNQLPTVALTNPASNQYFLAPPSITLEATASDPDGTVVNVEFYSDGVKIGETNNPEPSGFTFAWNNPPVGAYALRATAVDNGNGRTASAQVPIVVYDAVGTPVAKIISPPNGAVMEGPTNLLVTATANAISSVTNVQFLSNGVVFANATTGPYAAVWISSFGTNTLEAIAFDANGVRGTSPVVTVVITIPPTNTVSPTVYQQIPAAFGEVTNANFTNVTIIFSERVQGVDASDVLINGVPAANVTGSGSNYSFSFPRPPYGEVEVTFASGRGITDFGYPTNLPYNELDGTGFWSYNYDDVVPPTVAAHVPATSASVTNLPTVSVTFSEAVTGIDAPDLLVNGEPAFGVIGSGSNYVFDVVQPASGTVTITWATNHDITDLGVTGPPLAFSRTSVGATWSFTLDSRTTFVQSNSTWKYIKGLNEASDPTNAWRLPGFDDSSWTNSLAPFVFGEPTFTNALNPGTGLNDMTNNAYSSIYLRQAFLVANVNSITNLLLRHQSDDGFIAWINGVEVLRFNMPAGEIPFDGSAAGAANETGNAGAAYITATLTNAVAALVNGTNMLAVHAFNVVTNPASSDFVFNAQLYTFISDAAAVPPRVVSASPTQGDVFYLTNITVTFSESIAGVDAADLLVNGVPASAVASSTNIAYTFSFAQPAYGAVSITWATNHGIIDFDTPLPRPFNGNATSAKLAYTLVNPSAPTIFSQTPISSATVTGLTSIAITFSEPVTGVDAADLLVNGVAASGLTSPSPTNFIFTFPPPAYGTVTVRWATNNGIYDLEVPANDFDRTRPGNQWNYTLINPVPTVTMTSPTNNAYMLIGVNVPLRATASDNDGTIATVEYYEFTEGFDLGVASTSPYSVTWSNVSGGTYILRAIATDDSGLRATSAPVVINVVSEIPPQLVRGPYLQSGSSTGAVIRWRTDLPAGSLVRCGTNLNSLASLTVGTNGVTEHIVRIGGLQPNTKYFYSIGSSNLTLAGGPTLGGQDYWFVTLPVPGTRKPARFWVLGDSGTANANARAVRDAYYNFTTNGRPADFWLMLGDNAYNSGTDSEYQSAVFDMYPNTLRNLFLFPVLGNHESSQSTSTTITFPYLDIFSTPQNGEAGGLPSGNPKYYSFDYANIHFVALDSMTSGRETNSPMVLWLKDDLAATTQDWTIVYFHHSLYTKGTHDSDSEQDLVQMRQNFNPILEANGVDLVLMGHSHVYERSYLLDGHYGLSSTLTPSMKIDAGNGREDGTGAYRKNAEGRGVVYTIAGNGGQALGGPLNHPAHVVSLNLLGSLLIDVNSNRLDAMFLTSTGTTNDHYTLLKTTSVGVPVINSIAQSGMNVIITFAAGANVTYTLEQAPTPMGTWQAVETIDAATSNRVIQMMQPADAVNRYYRLRSP